jgi:hypothetical protein
VYHIINTPGFKLSVNNRQRQAKKGKERREKKDDEVEGAGIADNRKEVCQESS